MTPEEAAARRAELAAFDAEQAAKLKADALAPLAPLRGLLDGPELGAILDKIDAARDAIRDRRLALHLDGLVTTGRNAREKFGRILADLEAPHVPAPSLASTAPEPPVAKVAAAPGGVIEPPAPDAPDPTTGETATASHVSTLNPAAPAPAPAPTPGKIPRPPPARMLGAKA
jgi:hypothetical protein